MLSKERYEALEFRHSRQKLERPASVDVLELMHMAVEMNDKQWFDELSVKYNKLKADEEYVKMHLGIN